MVLQWCELYRVLDALQRRVDLEGLSNLDDARHVPTMVGEDVVAQAVSKKGTFSSSGQGGVNGP